MGSRLLPLLLKELLNCTAFCLPGMHDTLLVTRLLKRWSLSMSGPDGGFQTGCNSAA